MTDSLIIKLLLLIVILDFGLERILLILNYRSSKKPIPASLSDVYDADKYKQSQDYQRVLTRFGWIGNTFSFILLFVTLYMGWFGVLDKWVRHFSPLEYITPLYFFGTLMLVSAIINLPFEWYRHFVIESRFGFNKMTHKTFILDKIKSILLGAFFGGLLLVTFIILLTLLGKDFWLWFWGVAIIFMLLANFLYTTWILPLFNKLTPLPEGDLRNAIEALSQKLNFNLKNIYVMDGSKRSSKANAFFSGFGKSKKVVLYDTLLEKHTQDELLAIFAHEIGHYKKRHIVTMTLLGVLQTGIILFILSRMILSSELSWAMGGELTSIHLNLMAFGLLFTPISHVLDILMNYISRKHEYEADAFAAQHSSGTALISGLKKLSADNLSNLTPHPAFVLFNYSHPPLKDRLAAIDKLKS